MPASGFGCFALNTAWFWPSVIFWWSAGFGVFNYLLAWARAAHMAKQKGINTTQTFLPQRLHSVENSWRHEKPTAKLGFSRYINDSWANVACCGIAVPARAAKFIRLRSVLELVRPCPNFRRGMQVTWSSSTGMLIAKTLREDTSYAEVTNSSVVLFATRVIIVVLKKADIMAEHYKLSALEAGWMGDSQANELYWHL